MATPGSRLEAVLAAGMARMSLVPTDAPKREREFDDLDAMLADLLGPDEEEVTPGELADFLNREVGENVFDEDDDARDDAGVDGDMPQPQGTWLEFESSAPLRMLPEWITNPLPPRPTRPTRTSVKPDPLRGVHRNLTDQELSFVFWYTMHPVELCREIREAAPVLGETPTQFRDRITMLRSRLRRDYGMIVPKPFAAPWFGPPLGPEPELPTDSSLNKRDALGKRQTTDSELRYLYWYAMNPEELTVDKDRIMKIMTLTPTELHQKIYKIKQRVDQWNAELEKDKKEEEKRAPAPTFDWMSISGVSNEQASAIEAMVAGWKLKGPSLTSRIRLAQVKQLSLELQVTQQTIFWYLGAYYPEYVPQKYHKKP